MGVDQGGALRAKPRLIALVGRDPGDLKESIDGPEFPLQGQETGGGQTEALPALVAPRPGRTG